MATLLYVKQIKDSNLLRLGISEGEETLNYTVKATVYSEIGRPIRRDKLENWQMELILECDESYRAEKKALSILAYSDNSVSALVRKLRERGFSKDASVEVAKEMVRLGYIREGDQIERMVSELANKSLYGRRKILSHLVSRGYQPALINKVISEMESSGDVDFSENQNKLLEDAGICDRYSEEAKRLLYKKGY
jgi:SOS response regulatory protein OraA/RecX